jgi:hypothetical protein
MPMPLAVGREQGWPLRVWTCLAIAVLATPVLLAWQRAVGRRGGEPIINTRLFANLSYTLLLTAYSVFQLLPRCFMFTVSRLLQTGLGKSADRASVVFVCPRRALQRDLAARRPPGHASRQPHSGQRRGAGDRRTDRPRGRADTRQPEQQLTATLGWWAGTRRHCAHIEALPAHRHARDGAM